MKRQKIRASETPDNPQGIVVTRAQAERIALRDMPTDLKKAGFVSYVTDGARGWNLCYGKGPTAASSTSHHLHA